MARNLVQIKKQIAKLEKEAEDVKSKEIAGVIARIKKAIDFYELTSKDLFGSSVQQDGRLKKMASVVAKKQPKNVARAKFKDPTSDKTWTGHGKRPAWFLKATESGKMPEEMAV